MIEMEENKIPGVSEIKKRLYAMRNGILADSLRKGGCPHRLIWGLNLPQLNEIASEIEPSEDLALQLWEDKSLRESVLLAPMVYPADALTFDKALQLCKGIVWHEDADILCFKLLRNADFAPALAQSLCSSDEPLQRYAGLRLWFNLISKFPDKALAAAEAELNRPTPIHTLAAMLAEEARFLME